MAGIIEAVKTLNSLARTVLMAGVLGVLGFGGWAGYRAHHADKLAIQQKQRELNAFKAEIDTLTGDLANKQAALDKQSREITALRDMILERDADIEKLDAALRLLLVDQRMARVSVLDQRREDGAESIQTLFRFEELDAAGAPIVDAREFQIEGDILYVDAWVVKFDDEYIRKADLHRSTSLVLFRRLFGEFQAPRNGFVLDEVGARPRVYGEGEMSGFEKKIWSEFWTIANDPENATRLGIRAAHGEAPSIKLKPKSTYLIQLRASDGLSIVADDTSPAISKSDL